MKFKEFIKQKFLNEAELYYFNGCSVEEAIIKASKKLSRIDQEKVKNNFKRRVKNG